MIKYNLKCNNEHEFESWFSNSEEFEKLNNRNLLECIFCSSKKISKSIMAPMISSKKKDGEEIELINSNYLSEKNFEYVGKDFSKRVREIYYDKKSKKTIYGTATPEEREELSDEGIDLLSIPWVNKEN